MNSPIVRGEMIAPRVWGPFSAADLAAYAGASGDDNPLHLDPELARHAGLATPPVHGMLIMAALAPYLHDWRHDIAIGRITAKFVEPVLVGETFEITGKVVQAAEGAPAVVRLTVKRGAAIVCLAEAFVS